MRRCSCRTKVLRRQGRTALTPHVLDTHLGDMPRDLTIFLPVDAATVASVARDDPQRWLPAPAAAVPGGWVVTLHAGRAAHSVLCRVGPAVPASAGPWRPVSWEPSDGAGRVRAIDRFLPRFTGELGVLQAPGPTLVLCGSYEPPGAVVGTVAAGAGLERVAQATARRFLADVAKRLAAAAAAAAGGTPLALR